MHPFIDPVDARKFHIAVSILRKFFKMKGFTEVAVQHRLSILSACEDPFNVATFNYAGEVWPLPQTGQMWLEYELLKDPSAEGFFCVTTSYRQEPEPQKGRHNLIFPMFEFELHGDVRRLRQIEEELLLFAGFERPFMEDSYLNVAKSLGTKELTGEHEKLLDERYGPVYFLEYFPEYTSPFWNMKREGELAKKIDVILHGIETIGSAERSTDPDEMRDRFHSISGGAYARRLFALFTKDRVMKELDDFLSLPFFPRSGGGIGMNRWIRALKLEGIMPDFR